MRILESVRDAQVHLALFAAEDVGGAEFFEAAAGLTVRGARPLLVESVRPSGFLVLLELALARLDVLIPDVRRRYSLLEQPLHPKRSVADRAYDHIVVVLRRWRAACAHVVVRPAMIRAVDLRAKLALEREEVLLLTVLDRAVFAYTGEFHFNYLLSI